MNRFYTLIKTGILLFRSTFKRYRKSFWFGGIILIIIGFFIIQITPPSNFPINTYVQIPKGTSARSAADILTRAHIINSSISFILIARLTNTQNNIQAGTYRFNIPIGIYTVVYRLENGELDIAPIRITIPEGFTIRDMAPRIAKKIPNITQNDFIKYATRYEGYLFPDTYYFSKTTTVSEVINTMHKNFESHIAPLRDKIYSSGHTLKDIVIMASLVEKEARSFKTRQIIAGILWHRLRIGMPLQVDSVFGFIFNTQTYIPSAKDLKTLSPYNTYLHTGLPPGPIDNPGINSLRAAVMPIKTSYLYYLTGHDGITRYANTLSGHLQNEKHFLR